MDSLAISPLTCFEWFTVCPSKAVSLYTKIKQLLLFLKVETQTTPNGENPVLCFSVRSRDLIPEVSTAPVMRECPSVEVKPSQNLSSSSLPNRSWSEITKHCPSLACGKEERDAGRGAEEEMENGSV